MLLTTKEEGFSFSGSPTENCQDEEQLREAILRPAVGDGGRLPESKTEMMQNETCWRELIPQ